MIDNFHKELIMTLKELELFYHLSDNPHISQLAKKISMSQSAISLAIKSLEKKLSEPLFDRIGKKLILNERGRRFKEETYHHFLALKDAENFFKQETFSGVLKIASSKTVGEYIMPQLVLDFLLKYPNARIIKDIKNSSQIIQMVKEGEIDMGIIEQSCEDTHIVKELFGQDNLVVVSHDKVLGEKAFFIDQLFAKKWILREQGSGTRELFLQALGKVQKELDVFMEFTEFEEMKTLLYNNDDVITCVSKYVIAKELQREELHEVILTNITLKRDLYIIYHKDKYKTSLFKAFQNFIQKDVKTRLM
jgi:DNA-binding transcriptional LysR family regulator